MTDSDVDILSARAGAIAGMKEYYVYTLSRPDGTPFYVGKGCGDRVNQHEREAKRGCRCHKCNTIKQVWRNGGNILIAIVYRTDIETEALDYEVKLIASIGKENLTNITDGGDGTSGRPVTEKTRLAVSKANSNRIHTQEEKQKHRLAALGRKQSLETRQKIGNANKGHSFSQEARAKIGNAHKGVVPVAASLAGNTAWRGKHHTPETIAHLKEAALSLTPEQKKKRTEASQEAHHKNIEHKYQSVIKMLEQGESIAVIVETTGVSQRTVYRWRKQQHKMAAANG